MKKPKFTCKASKKVCRELKQFVDSSNFKYVDFIYVAPLKTILKEYQNDEMVEYRLVEEGNIAMNRNADYEGGREVIVASTHPSYKKYGVSGENLIDELKLSIRHEVAHLSGIEDEEEAEEWARDKSI